MNANNAIKMSLEMSGFVAMGYLTDLTDQEMMHRPCPGCNHINWQLGHLINSEHRLVGEQAPGSRPPLPQGFAEKYSAERATLDDPRQFCTKAELMKAYDEQRAATLAALEKTSEKDLDKPTGIEYAPTVGSVFSMQGAHWLMHAGQWAVIRRQLGRKPLF